MSRITLPIIALACLACEDIDSTDVATGGIYLDVDVVANGEGTTLLRAELLAGGAASNTYLRVTGGDQLVAEADDDRRTLVQREGDFGDIWYTAEFPVDRIGTGFRVSLLREDQASADETVARLPARFALTGPSAGRTWRPSQETIQVTWDGSTRDRMRITVEGPCVDDDTWEVAQDVGRYLLHPGAVSVHGSCEMEVRVERVREGKVDHRLDGGRVVARQMRRVKIRVAP